MDESRDEIDASRRRGRPRQVERRAPGEGLPYQQPLDSLPATTRTMLDAARDVLLERGMNGLTLEAVAAAAHVDVTTIYYHFGSKAGLLEALIDSLFHEALAAFARQAATAESIAARLRAYIEAIRFYIRTGERTQGRAYFELVSSAYRDPRLRARLAALNEWHVEQSVATILGSDEETRRAVLGDAARRRRVWEVACFVFAAVDGIELHHDLDPERFPLDEACDVLLRCALAEVDRLLAGDA